MKVPLKEIRLEITQKCNLCCKYCYVEHLTKADETCRELSFEEIKELIEQGIKQDLETVSLTGGEPFLKYDLVKKIIKFAADKGLKTGILTNGTLCSEDKIKQLKELGLTWVRISLDGSNKEINSMTRDERVFDKIIETIKSTKKFGLYTIVRTTATDKNKDNLKDLTRLAIELKADKVDLQPFFPTNDQKIDKEFLVSAENLKKTGAELLKFRRKIKEQIELIFYSHWFEFLLPEYQNETVYNSSCGKSLCFVDAVGIVRTCGPNQKNLGNIRDENVLEIWNNNPYLQQLRKNERYGICKTCNKFELCLNSCPAATYNLHKEHEHSPPLCPKVRESEYKSYS